MAKEERYENTFATGDHCELSLTNVRGQVQITGWDRPEVSVVAVKRLGSYWGAQQAFEETTVAMDQEGPAVSLRTRMARTFNPFAWMGLGTTPPEVEYTVQVPAKSEVAVRVVAGLLAISHIRGAVYARTVNGDIHLEDVSGNLIVHGVNGRVSAQEISGNVAVRTVNGNVSIRRSRLASLKSKTVSGDISLESPLEAQGQYAAKTVSGSLRLFVPAATRATLELVSTSGKMRCDLPCQLSEPRRGHWRGTLNGGGAAVDARSVSGDLIIGEAGPEEPPPAAAQPGPEPAARGESPEMVVLRAVERGQMSVEEGLQQLEDLMGQA